jgi:hypothetical protein
MGGRCQLCVNEPCIGKNPLDLTCLRKGPANAKGRVATDPKEIAGLLCQVPKGSARFWILLERCKVPLESRTQKLGFRAGVPGSAGKHKARS